MKTGLSLALIYIYIYIYLAGIIHVTLSFLAFIDYITLCTYCSTRLRRPFIMMWCKNKKSCTFVCARNYLAYYVGQSEETNVLKTDY